ncbi:peptide-methionine (R)-S-oxide reductase MsrB [Mucilaginibacter sp. PPCGB 2223]|uniref:peptide-methionine (R)-S-oxide reductase MsrB n=1 Tax=Mucilaginibacter sp. PPCGB 2223 TaxID=1886027 RepID=UPI0009F3EE04|nr:peptide-methionine (R)-S-oxide reductase MsrB [Mucilaginibacter sp. PPCGB 2223]
MKKINIAISALLLLAVQACSQNHTIKPGTSEDVKTFPGARPNSYWKSVLSSDTYDIMVNKGTEPPFRNPYWDNHQRGIYLSAATGKPLFSSDAKFDSGTGWPSFFKPIDEKDIMIVEDDSYGEVRQEVLERSTGLHLGHIFDDGPAPTGKRYCLDSYALKFVPAK